MYRAPLDNARESQDLGEAGGARAAERTGKAGSWSGGEDQPVPTITPALPA